MMWGEHLEIDFDGGCRAGNSTGRDAVARELLDEVHGSGNLHVEATRPAELHR